eukprot:CAMPEP_0185843876 /NCGR_PEP_ID=MMETSP1354-20130828/254_1 /TAXON_ID=708628 /ORGANISM="Erythrolobus madagascarensis, Strain CCMP3276" /LENGTH=312 /DNA_ID=CAMNT_0028543455 /DNA_START=54 /DNA_END=992 /DNA_ORIENTATION=+
MEERLPFGEMIRLHDHHHPEDHLDIDSFLLKHDDDDQDGVPFPNPTALLELHREQLQAVSEVSGLRPDKRTAVAEAEKRIVTVPAKECASKESDSCSPKSVMKSSSVACSGGITKNQRRFRSEKSASKYCHLCQRSASSVKLIACSNLKKLVCRKSVCVLCFVTEGWDFARALAESDTWTCPHCNEACPPRSQCVTYTKTNQRRKERSGRGRPSPQSVPDRSLAPGVGATLSHGAPIAAPGRVIPLAPSVVPSYPPPAQAPMMSGSHVAVLPARPSQQLPGQIPSAGFQYTYQTSGPLVVEVPDDATAALPF